jgi:hypothetical protein
VDQEQLIELKKRLFDAVPQSGNVGNVTLCATFKRFDSSLTDDDYWLVKSELVNDGLLRSGRGRGGSVHRVESEIAIPEPASINVNCKPEADLYEPFHKAIRDGYVKDNGIRRYVSEETAKQGRRYTGGKWTRPDITLVAIRTFQYMPKEVEVISFEIKPTIETALEGVFESAAHSAFTHRSFLAFPDPNPPDREAENPISDRIHAECERFGVGLILFGKDVDWATFDFAINARRNNPDPAAVDEFLITQLSAENQRTLRDLLA